MLRRTPLKRSSKPMKRTPLKRKSKSLTKKLQDELWQLCREMAMKLYPPNCYTCDSRGLTGSNRQLGHMWPKASLGAHLKYDLRVLRWQDYHCNINLGGNGAVFYERMVEEIGKKEMEKLVKEKQILVRADTLFYMKKIADYQSLLATL